MMRLFKRRGSDPNPQLESVSTLSENDHSTETRMPSNPAMEIQKPYLSTWSKAWEKIRRQDSSELLPHKTKKRNIGESSASELSFENLPKHAQNIFENAEKTKITDDDVKKVYEMYKNVSNGTAMRNGPLRNTIRSRRNVKCISDNIELNQQQFLDYLMLMKPNSEDLDKIFDSKEGDERGSPRLDEKKKNRRSKLKSMFTIRSSSKSDDESETAFKKINQKSSSTDSLSSILNYIMPKRRQASKSPTVGTKFKSDESGYGSDSTKTTTLDSPVGSIKSQTSHDVDTDTELDQTLVDNDVKSYRGLSDDTDTVDEDEDVEMETTYTFSKFYGRSPTKAATKKRARSQSRDESVKNVSKKPNVKLKRSPSSSNKTKISGEDISQCCDQLNNLKLSESDKIVNLEIKKTGHACENVLEKEFKCIRLKVKDNEMVGIKISPNYGKNQTCSYTISEILPNSVASRNENVKVGDEVIKANGIRIKGLSYQTVKLHFVPKNNELELVISRTLGCVKPLPKISKKNSFKAFLSKPAAILSPKNDSNTILKSLSKSSIAGSVSISKSPSKIFISSSSLSSSKNGASLVKSPQKTILKSSIKLSSQKNNSSTSISKSPSKSSIASEKLINPQTPGTKTTVKKSLKAQIIKPSSNSYSQKSPVKFQKDYVGLADILKGNSDLESRVTFSEKAPKPDIVSNSKDIVRGKPPFYLKAEEKGVFKSPCPVKKFLPSPDNNKFKLCSAYPKPSYSGTSVSRSPSPRLGHKAPSRVSPSPHGMRKFSLSSSAQSQLSKGVPKRSEQMTRSKTCDKVVTFTKGPGKKSLGFSVVGGKDSPKGPMGIYVKTIFKDGQASDSKVLQEGDELLSINGTSFQGLSHLEAVTLFKTIKCGEVVIEAVSRHPFRTYSHSM